MKAKLILLVLTVVLVSAFVPSASAQQFVVWTESSQCNTSTYFPAGSFTFFLCAVTGFNPYIFFPPVIAEAYIKGYCANLSIVGSSGLGSPTSIAASVTFIASGGVLNTTQVCFPSRICNSSVDPPQGVDC
jgi:hypothetical protein